MQDNFLSFSDIPFLSFSVSFRGEQLGERAAKGDDVILRGGWRDDTVG